MQTSETVPTCITGADFFNGKRIRTVEGIAARNDRGEVTTLSPVQQAFLDYFSFQCGYCTPGFVNAATVLIERLRRVADRAQRRGNDGCGSARKSHLPLHGVRSLLRGRSRPDPEDPRPDADYGMSRPRHLWRWVIGLGALAGIAIGVFFSINLLRGKTDGPVQVVNAPADVVARGKYLAEAADCAACHTAPGGAPFAGGLAMQSGFGTIYATNITPDPDYRNRPLERRRFLAGAA